MGMSRWWPIFTSILYCI